MDGWKAIIQQREICFFRHSPVDWGEKSTCARHPCVFHKGHENLLYLYALIPSFGYTLRLLRSLSE